MTSNAFIVQEGLTLRKDGRTEPSFSKSVEHLKMHPEACHVARPLMQRDRLVWLGGRGAGRGAGAQREGGGGWDGGGSERGGGKRGIEGKGENESKGGSLSALRQCQVHVENRTTSAQDSYSGGATNDKFRSWRCGARGFLPSLSFISRVFAIHLPQPPDPTVHGFLRSRPLST
jgi:hypothetical protein